ncbi:uncharacterized protein LOC127868957 [Dreissena polymorpha]|uniref:DUF4773 domain-containing protein n=1 Tax=Dreissena polymorpha TaxID=45954 RepID=A0A9D4RLE8_DREPO|nr:uncharacterized protein LOC127868957 [Dreissena polymorpha]KAH3873151.1 hypothetical protein DPMN_036378 [Dreissena polymorpha]
MSSAFYFALLVGVGILATRGVTCFTNKDFLDMAIEYGAEIQKEDSLHDVNQNNDDVIDLPGDQDDELDVEFLIKKFVITFSENGSDIYLGNLGSGCSCRRYTCNCCVRHTYRAKIFWKRVSFTFNGCVSVRYLPQNFGIRLTITFNGRILYNREVSLRHPPHLCFGVPGLRGFARICLQIYNVNFAQKSLCARLVGTIDLKLKKWSVHLNLGCFRIPILAEDHITALVGNADSRKLTFEPFPQNAPDADVNELTELFRALRGLDEDY